MTPPSTSWSPVPPVHARAGVSCADCHMPYMREGATEAGGATAEQLAPALALQQKGQWRLDFIAAEPRLRAPGDSGGHAAAIDSP